MIPATLPASEGRRIDALLQYDILDTAPEQSFDDITLLASQVCETPIALVSLVDKHRQWFKSLVGLDATQTSRHDSFCGHAILQDEVFIVQDTLKDLRFFDSPLVLDDPYIRFYAGAPLITPSGENIGTVCVIDTTPRDLTETQRNSLLALSRQVVSQMELRSALQNAKCESESKTRFLANISHEIRTPMNAVSSCTNLLIDQIEDEKHRQMLKMISNASENLIALVDEILDLSKEELEDIDVRDVSFNPRELLNEVAQILAVRAVEMNRTVYTNIDDTVPRSIMGDPNRVRQLLYNLAGNATKFCSSEVALSLDVKRNPESEVLLITVKDDGPGIAEEDQLKIFQEFAQAGESLGVTDSGTGMGLTICKSLCKAMNGSISVASKLNVGSIFSVELPLRTSQAPDFTQEPPLVFKIDSKMSENHPTRILVAEDSEVNQFIISAMLDKLGYTVDLVSDGREAVDASRKGDYDLIFMDIRMPYMNGEEATQEIRKSAIRQPTIVALTANAFEDDKSRCLKAGMDGFITKPINLESLVDAIISNKNS